MAFVLFTGGDSFLFDFFDFTSKYWYFKVHYIILVTSGSAFSLLAYAANNALY